MKTYTFDLSEIENIFLSGLINEVDKIFNSMYTKIENGNVVFLVRKLKETHTDTVEIFCEESDLLNYQSKFMLQHHVSLNKLIQMKTMNLETVSN